MEKIFCQLFRFWRRIWGLLCIDKHARKFKNREKNSTRRSEKQCHARNDQNGWWGIDRDSLLSTVGTSAFDAKLDFRRYAIMGRAYTGQWAQPPRKSKKTFLAWHCFSRAQNTITCSAMMLHIACLARSRSFSCSLLFCVFLLFSSIFFFSASFECSISAVLVCDASRGRQLHISAENSVHKCQFSIAQLQNEQRNYFKIKHLLRFQTISDKRETTSLSA